MENAKRVYLKGVAHGRRSYFETFFDDHWVRTAWNDHFKRMAIEKTVTNRLDILYVGFFLCVGGFVVCGIYALVGITIALQLPDWTLSLTVTR